VGRCASQGASFALPEHRVDPAVTFTVVSTLASEPTLAALHLDQPAPPCRVVDSGDLNLRNSILLI
jgi:hypothetical protein